MADSTYAVKVSEELKERIQKLIDESGQSSKEFFSSMVSQFELANTREQTPILATDIDELTKLTSRINGIFINVGERISNMHEVLRTELEQQIKEKESQIRLLQQQAEGLRCDIAHSESQIEILATEKEALIAEANQLKEVNQKNNNIIYNCNEKISTLNGIANQYKSYADENESLKDEIYKIQQNAEALQKENEKLNTALEDYRIGQRDLIKKYSEDMERQKEKLELEKEKALLDQREQYNKELDEIRDMYQEKINQLLQLNNKPKRESKKKVVSAESNETQ